MDLITHIDRNFRGLFLDEYIDDDNLIFTTRRNLYDIAHRFKYLYDIYICALGYNMLHIKMVTDKGIVNIDVKRSNFKE
jgi:hypothetical protein